MLNFKYQQEVGYEMLQTNYIRKNTLKNKIGIILFLVVYTALSFYAYFPIIDPYIQGFIKLLQQFVFYSFLAVMLWSFVKLKRTGEIPLVEFTEISKLKPFLNDNKYKFAHLNIYRCIALMALNDPQVNECLIESGAFKGKTISEVKDVLDARSEKDVCTKDELDSISSVYINNKINDSKTFSDILIKC